MRAKAIEKTKSNERAHFPRMCKKEENMKTGQIICDQCKKPLVHPAMIDLKMKYRANVGVSGEHESTQYPGITKGIMGYVEVDIEGDFCDAECLSEFALQTAIKQNQGVSKVRQDIYFRGDPFTPGRPKSEW